MEADWEFDLGADSPVIDACWPGLVDLRARPADAAELAEAAQFPPLADALERLNAEGSPVWTSKCDYFPALRSDEFDAGELDAAAKDALHAMACYIDLHPRGDEQWPAPSMAEAACGPICERMRAVPLRCCRVDLVIRRTYIVPDQDSLGVTSYLTACGHSAAAAAATLAAALDAFAYTVIAMPAPSKPH